MDFKDYEELCEDLEKEISEIKDKKESVGYFHMRDLCALKELLACVKYIKVILDMKKDEYYEKGAY